MQGAEVLSAEAFRIQERGAPEAGPTIGGEQSPPFLYRKGAPNEITIRLHLKARAMWQ